jgi:hypothetical protein
MVLPQLLGIILEQTGAIDMLQDAVFMRVRWTFGKAYNLQMYLAIGFAAAQLPATALVWTSKDYSQPDQNKSFTISDEKVLHSRNTNEW